MKRRKSGALTPIADDAAPNEWSQLLRQLRSPAELDRRILAELQGAVPPVRRSAQPWLMLALVLPLLALIAAGAMLYGTPFPQRIAAQSLRNIPDSESEKKESGPEGIRAERRLTIPKLQTDELPQASAVPPPVPAAAHRERSKLRGPKLLRGIQRRPSLDGGELCDALDGFDCLAQVRLIGTGALGAMPPSQLSELSAHLPVPAIPAQLPVENRPAPLPVGFGQAPPPSPFGELIGSARQLEEESSWPAARWVATPVNFPSPGR